MPKGRTAIATAPAAVEVQIDHGAIDAANRALTSVNQQATELMANFGLAHAQPDVLVDEIRGYMLTATQATLEIGMRLTTLRAMCARGEFGRRLEGLGIAPRLAQKLMQCALKFCRGGQPRKAFETLGQGKLLELLVLDDEQIDALERGEDLLELDIDEVSAMSTSELRKKLRELGHKVEAQDKLLAAKNKKLDELTQSELERKAFRPKKGSDAQSQGEAVHLAELADATRQLEAAAMRLAVVVADVRDNSGSEVICGRAYQAVQYATKRVQEVFLDHQLDVGMAFEELVAAGHTSGREGDLADTDAPAWLNATPRG